MSPDHRYDRIRAALREHPWAIVPSMLELVVEIIDRRIEGREPSAEEIEAEVQAARRPRAVASAGKGDIAVIPVFGVLAHRAHLFRNVSQTGTSTEVLTLAVRAAVKDPDVASIVLDVDSPGGSAFGIQELAGAIAEASRVKPVVAVANSVAGSAAYWIASQAGELVVTPGGFVGSVGVYTVHDDYSERARQMGVKRTYVAAGKHKVEGNPYEPLGEETRTELQRQVDLIYDQFVRAIASGRGVSLKRVREDFGQGRMVLSQEAVDRGMADRVETLQQVIDRLANGGAARPARARAESEPEIAADEPEAPAEAPAAQPAKRPAAARDLELLELAEASRRRGA